MGNFVEVRQEETVQHDVIATLNLWNPINRETDRLLEGYHVIKDFNFIYACRLSKLRQGSTCRRITEYLFYVKLRPKSTTVKQRFFSDYSHHSA